MENENKVTLKELRARKDVSQEVVAEALGIAVPTYRRRERDLREVKVKYAIDIADYFGVELQDIV